MESINKGRGPRLGQKVDGVNHKVDRIPGRGDHVNHSHRHTGQTAETQVTSCEEVK